MNSVLVSFCMWIEFFGLVVVTDNEPIIAFTVKVSLRHSAETIG